MVSTFLEEISRRNYSHTKIMFSLVLYLSRFLSELFVVLFFGFSFFFARKTSFWPVATMLEVFPKGGEQTMELFV